jgi:hypothetical protein
LSLVVVVVVLCRGGVERSLVGPGLGLLVVGGVGLLEGVAVADAAVDHAGKMHCHRREGGGGNGGGSGGGVVERWWRGELVTGHNRGCGKGRVAEREMSRRDG